MAKLFRAAKEDEPCPKCADKLHRKAGTGRDPGEVPPIVYDVLRSPGQPLEEGVREDMGQRFGGIDFSGVRIHTDSRAAESAEAVNARAYTVGQDIVFRSSEFAPGRGDGAHLLAHELAHVLHQTPENNGVRRWQPTGSIRIDSSHESDAERVAQQVVPSHAPQPPRVNADSPLSVQRVVQLGIGALAAKCMVGALLGALLDVGIQAGTYAWKHGTTSGFQVDYCSVILSAILGCVGGVVAAKWVAPWIAENLAPELGALGGTLLGRILLFLATRLAIGVPRWVVKSLLKLGCISIEQAEALAPGISSELEIASEEDSGQQVEAGNDMGPAENSSAGAQPEGVEV
jgi:hypothetical protein